MKAVVADTSPLNYLVQISEVAILSDLFGSIIVLAEVVLELSDPEALIAVGDWIREPPAWIEIRPALACFALPGLPGLDVGQVNRGQSFSL